MVKISEVISKIGNKIPIITGPTGIGKTSFSIKLARKIKGEIISIDSRQIYKNFIIGTAQPSNYEQTQAKHYLINYLEHSKIISAGNYIQLVKEKIVKIKKSGKVPIIVGGSMLYVNSLCFGIINKADSNPTNRKKYFDYIKSGNKDFLFNKLKLIDPKYAKKVSYNDHKKLVRALEIFDLTGKSPTEVFHEQTKIDKNNRDKFFIIEIITDRKKLRKDIHKRTVKMIENGWIDEVKALISAGINKNSHPMQSLGYRHIISYLNKEIKFDELLEQISTKTWQYAKKQLTWLKKMDINLQISLDDIN